LKILFLFLLFTSSVYADQIVVFTRPDKGVPVTEAERQKATEDIISILKNTQYFDFGSSRIHGWPENDPTKKFWWANFWTGVQVSKLNGKVTYTHQNNGSDNAGIHTAPWMEGACYAYLLTGEQQYAHLAQRTIRAFSGWILSSARSKDDSPKILSRAFYPESFSSNEFGRDLIVNYNASRPGINSEPSGYVHIPNNPTFGDTWVKNNRSIDDIGQMARAMSQTQACRNVFNAEAKADLDQMNSLYSTWAKSVEDAHFIIPTFNFNAEIFSPKNAIGDFNVYKILGFDPNCTGKLALRMLYTNDPKNFNCGNGISKLEKIVSGFLKNDAVEILRSHHIAAIATAERNSLFDITNKLRIGLSKRMDIDMELVKNPTKRPDLDIQDIAAFLVHSYNVGVPMNSDELHFVYERLHTAATELSSPAHFNTFHLFDSKVPDGNYSYDAPQAGLYFYTIGPMIGTCASNLISKNNDRPMFDCEKIKQALKH
jgi:hypothetical protein